MITKIKQFISGLLIDPVISDPMTRDLSGTVIVITGASRGLGLSVAKAAYRQGASIALLSRSPLDLEKTLDGYDARRAIHILADVSSATSMNQAVAQVIAHYSQIDVLINNAGAIEFKPIDQVSDRDYDRTMDTNVKGMFYAVRAVLPSMKARKEGFIINIGSKISHNTNVEPNKVMYATSKYAVEGFSFALNKELKSFGIRVACLMPGTLNTFISMKSKLFLSPFDLAYLIIMMIKFKNVDFESIIVKSIHQDI